MTIALMAVIMLATSGCVSRRVTQKEYQRTTILDDQEVPLKPWVTCHVCNGKGTCQRCNGIGKAQGRKCVTCDGTGKCTVCAGEGGYRQE